MRVRVVRFHRPDSWTRAFVGEVLHVLTTHPRLEVAGVIGAPYVPEAVLGWDVDMTLLTPNQREKLWKLSDGLLVGELFAPAECVEVLQDR